MDVKVVGTVSTLAAVRMVLDEVSGANEKYGELRSTHEGYGVLAEEVAELLEAIHCNDPHRVRTESVHVAAVALRLVEICHTALSGEAPEFSKRSGFDG